MRVSLCPLLRVFISFSPFEVFYVRRPFDSSLKQIPNGAVSEEVLSETSIQQQLRYINSGAEAPNRHLPVCSSCRGEGGGEGGLEASRPPGGGPESLTLLLETFLCTSAQLQHKQQPPL